MLTRGCAPTGRGTVLGAREQPAAQLVAAAGRHRSCRAALVELDAALGREVEQLLALLALAREAQEEPREQADGQKRALDHHDRAGDVLVLDGGDVPPALPGGVARVEDRARP